MPAYCLLVSRWVSLQLDIYLCVHGLSFETDQDKDQGYFEPPEITRNMSEQRQNTRDVELHALKIQSNGGLNRPYLSFIVGDI